MLIERFGRSPEETKASAQQSYDIGTAQWQGTREVQNDVIRITTEADGGRDTVLAMADGLGTGREAGRAAEAAIEAIFKEYFRSGPDEKHHQVLLRMIGSAQAQVQNMNGMLRQRGEMSTGVTVACVLIRDGRAAVASVGNVRVFLYRSGRLMQLNRDNILSLEAEERDILSGEEPEIDPEWAMKVTAYVGMEGLSNVDYTQSPIRLISTDRIMLMSSGLYGVLPESELCRMLEETSPQLAAERVIARVKASSQQSQSNASVIVLRVNRRRRTSAFSSAKQRN